MVVFTCSHCGESVQKPKVVKHYLTKCRYKNPSLSCMDCFKDFLGEAYEEHTKCITEQERYSGKGFVAKEKKGEKKQNTWIEMLQSVIDEQQGAPKNVLRIIETISKHNNTPRKKPKFINFVKNVCGHKTSPKDIDQAWDLISVKLSALSQANQQNKNNKAQSNDDEEANETDKGIKETETIEADSTQNDEEQNNTEDGDADNKDSDNKDTDNIETENKGKKLSKKQKKEQKKRLKYEAELQSAVEPPSEDEKVVETKKGKKKTKSESENDITEKESKKNKRKRQDTVNSVNGHQELPDNNTAVIQNGVAKEKQKKKAKIDAEEEEDVEESLHNQNVAKIGELNVNDKFNWHAVIMSVLEKKGNELPFKRLQKKVLAEYSEITGQDIDDRIADKFIKKLKSAPNVRVDKNRVLLVQ